MPPQRSLIPRPARKICLVLVATLGVGSAWAAPARIGSHGSPGLRGTTGGRTQGYLGIEFHDASEKSLKSLRGTTHGVEIVMVDHDGPAGKAGLRAHDIIVNLNGQAVAGAEALRRMIHDAGAGVQIAMTVLRSGQLLQISAMLGNREEVARAAMAHLLSSDGPPPAEDAAMTSAPAVSPAAGAPHPGTMALADSPAPPVEPATPPPGSGFIGHIVHGGIYTGAVLEVMEPQLAGFFGAPQGTGLLVHSVQPGSPAATAGLRAGDVVLRADQYAMKNQTDWAHRLHAAKGRPISLVILRDRRELNLSLQQDLKHHSMLEFPGL